MNRLWGRLKKGSFLSKTLVVLLVGALVFAAVNADRYESPRLDLHDAGIWVSWTGEQAVGRTNTEIRQVDTRVDAASSRFDILQSGEYVLVQQQSPPLLKGVDPRRAEMTPLVELPETAEVGLGGNRAAILERSSGSYWLTDADAVGSIRLDDDESPPTGVIGGDARLAMGLDGTAHVLDLTAGEFQSVAPDGSITTAGLDAEDLESVEVTVVGGTPVAIDNDEEVLLVPGHGPIDISDLGAAPVLQQPGPDNDAVFIATESGLWRVPLSGEDAEQSFETDAELPAAPVFLNDCAYGAWGGSAEWARACGDDEATTDVFPQISTPAELRWRVNRDRVLLNEMSTGLLLVFINGEPQLIDNWAQALSDRPVQAPDPSDEVEEVDPEIDEINDPPVAEDDEAATRPERPVVVRPLANDRDPDGDVLSVIRIGAVNEDVGTVSIIDGGQAIQVTPAPGQTRPIIFEYTIDDGHDLSDSATVSVAVHDLERNEAPEPVDDETLVESGQVVAHNVLVNDVDPDGDALTLTGAESEPEAVIEIDDTGRVNFHAPARFVGDAIVTYTTVDEFGEEAGGVLTVHVLQPEVNEPPVARNDHASSFVDREVVIDLLQNDSDANNDPLRVVEVENRSSADVRWEQDSSEVRVVGTGPGPVIVKYTVSDGPTVDEAFLRVDVRAPADQNPPVAVRDDVVLRPGTPAIVSMLDNDVDLDGDVLVVQSVGVPAASPISVELVERSIARVTSNTPLVEPVSFTYQITDGSGEATGTVVVRPGSEDGQNQPPVTVDDESTVRAGNIAAVNVLSNDSDPERDVLTLVEATVPRRDGSVFIQGDVLRYEAPDERRSAVIGSYVIEDSGGNRVAGTVTFRVTPPDPDDNSAPVAPTVTARTVAGQSVEIKVPVTTIDPDGDPVTLEGLEEPPRLGSVIEILPDRIVYLPDESAAGTDTFRYAVRDQYGAESTGTMLVGIARPARRNSQPVAVPDEVIVRPGSRVQIDVLRNDSDPDGEAIFVGEADDDMLTQPSEGEVSLDDGLVIFDAEGVEDDSLTSFGYVVSDRRGGRANGTVQIRVSSTVPNQPPIAIDDILLPQAAGSPVEVPVLDNDTELDNEVLEITDATGEGVRITADGLRFTMPDESVTFSYEISDGTRGNTARAAVQVPLADNGAPRVGLDELTTDENDRVTVDVLDNDADPEGEDLVLVDVIGERHGRAEIDGDRVRFIPEEDYVGTAGFSYIVADAEREADQLTSVGTAKITVESTSNTPPEWTELVLSVPQDGQTSVDLRGGVHDIDEADDGVHTFSDLDGEDDGVTADIEDDHILVVEAASDAELGARVPLTFTVTDGRRNGEIDGQVLVEVTSSNSEKVRPVTDQARAFEGQAVTIPVLNNDIYYNQSLLRIANVEQPAAGGTVDISGSELEFTPTDGFFGTTSFAYTVGDETEDPDREVEGTVQVTVIGRPEVPPAPTGVVESHVVNLQWGVPANNGAPITEYIVRASNGREERTSANSIRFDNLDNGVDVTFQVAAINEAVRQGGGRPEFGPASATFKPDEIPDIPSPPQPTDFGDGTLDISWTLPPVDGSPINEVVIEISPPPERGSPQQTFGAGQTSTTWTNLSNGTHYSFRMRASNDAGSSAFSGRGPSEYPAAPPGPPGTPTVQETDRNLIVSWSAPTEVNGDAPTAYSVRVIGSGSAAGTIEIPNGGARSTTVGTVNGVDYSFEIAATNKAGRGAFGGRSAPTSSFGEPDPVGNVEARDGDHQAQLIFSEQVDGNGRPIDHFEYDVNGNQAWTQISSGGYVSGLENRADVNYRFRVRAVNSESLAGDPSPPSNPANPYGAPSTPSISANDSGKSVNFNWSTSSGNGRTVTGYEVSVNSGGWQSVGGSTSRSVNVNDWGDGASLRVRAVANGADPARQRSGEAGTSGTTASPTASAYKSGTSAVGRPGCTHPSCRYVGISVSRFRNNTSYSYRCYSNAPGDSGDFGVQGSFTTDGSGSFSGNSVCYFGYPGSSVYFHSISSPANEPSTSQAVTW